MKISISLEPDDLESLKELVASRKAANLSHAVRLCINEHRQRLEVVA
jgi:Arc/MetJ-type ribon-helix-helix transcriptional regulator